MKLRLMLVFVLLSISAFADEAPKTQATLTMVDGSSVKGELLTEEIKGVTVFDQKVAVPVVLLRSVTPGTTNTPAKLAFVNGDTLSIKMTTDELKLNSILGKLEVPMKSLILMRLDRGSSIETHRRTSAGNAGATSRV